MFHQMAVIATNNQIHEEEGKQTWLNRETKGPKLQILLTVVNLQRSFYHLNHQKKGAL